MLHACCAPCASYPVIKLQKDGFEPVVFFYNPNIYPKKEYDIRKDELKKYCESLNITFIEGKYEPEIYLNKIKGFENEKEKGKRCSLCFNLRLNETAKAAKENKIKYFTTTLTVSPHKNSGMIFDEAKVTEEKYKIKFLEYNFKKQDGFKISRQIAKENNMYFQKYCGCKFSIGLTGNKNEKCGSKRCGKERTS